MKNASKRLLSFLLVLTMVLTLIPVTARAAEIASGKCGGNAVWTLTDDGVLTVSGSGPMTDYESEMGGTPWYDHAWEVDSIVIGEGITTVGDYAFANMIFTTSMQLPSTLTRIGKLAFWATQIQDIVIPANVKEIGMHAFSTPNTRINSIYVAAGNPYFKVVNGVMYSKDGTELVLYPSGNAVDSYTIPSGVTKICDSAFAYSRIPAVTIPAGVTQIGDYVFYGSGLTNLYFAGNAPAMTENSLSRTDLTVAMYPAGNSTYTSGVTSLFSNIQWYPDNTALDVVLQPESVQIIAGNYTMFELVAVGKDLSYQWQYRTSANDGWKNASEEGNRTGSLYVLAEEGKDGYQYRCKITDGKDSVVYSDVVTMTVRVPSRLENARNEFYQVSDLKIGSDGVYRTPENQLVYIAVNNYLDGGNVEWLSGNTLYDYVESYGEEYFDLTYWDELKSMMDAEGYVPLTDESLNYLIVLVTGNPAWGEDESYIPYYLFYDRAANGNAAEASAVRLAGEDRFDTAFKAANELKAVLGVEKFDCVVIASGAEFADALAGSYLAAVKEAPILLSYKAKQNALVQDYIKENLAPGGTVYILGGTSAVPSSMEAGLQGLNVKRLAGADRFETNLLILKEAGVKAGDEILVCTGKEFADSLSASATGKPILLVYKKLTDGQKAYLSNLNGNKFCIVGGENAVSASLESAIGEYGEITRLAGKDRLVTSVMVAEKYFSNPESAVVAYGWNYPDGLCGGPLAYAMKAPLILTHSKDKYYAVSAGYTQEQGITGGYVLGGSGLVSNQAACAILGVESIVLK